VEAEERREHLEERKRPDHQDGSRHRVVVLREALLDRVAEDDQEDEVERLERPELAAPDDPRQRVDEEEQEDRAEDEIR